MQKGKMDRGGKEVCKQQSKFLRRETPENIVKIRFYPPSESQAFLQNLSEAKMLQRSNYH